MIKTFTLAYNTPSTIADRLNDMKNLSKSHTVIDLGFPLQYDEYPDNVELSALLSSHRLSTDCFKYGANYIKLPNKGVSQNWTSVFRILEVGLDDVLIGIEPDEVCDNYDWVFAMGDIINAEKKIAVVSLNTIEHQKLIDDGLFNCEEQIIGGHRVYIVNGLSNWGMIGINGRFLHRFDGVPIPNKYSIYGHIESACYSKILEAGYKWCILADHYCRHIETSQLYRHWKTDITSGEYTAEKQISFDKWLKIKNGNNN